MFVAIAYLFDVYAEFCAVNDNTLLCSGPSALTGTKGLGFAQADIGKLAWTESYTPFGEAFNKATANDNLEGFTGHIKTRRLA